MSQTKTLGKSYVFWGISVSVVLLVLTEFWWGRIFWGETSAVFFGIASIAFLGCICLAFTCPEVASDFWGFLALFLLIVSILSFCLGGYETTAARSKREEKTAAYERQVQLQFEQKIQRITKALDEELSKEAKELFSFLKAVRGNLHGDYYFILPELVSAFFPEKEVGVKALNELIETSLFVLVDAEGKEFIGQANEDEDCIIKIKGWDFLYRNVTISKKTIRKDSQSQKRNLAKLKMFWEAGEVAKHFPAISDQKLLEAVNRFSGEPHIYFFNAVYTAWHQVKDGC